MSSVQLDIAPESVEKQSSIVNNSSDPDPVTFDIAANAAEKDKGDPIESDPLPTANEESDKLNLKEEDTQKNIAPLAADLGRPSTGATRNVAVSRPGSNQTTATKSASSTKEKNSTKAGTAGKRKNTISGRSKSSKKDSKSNEHGKNSSTSGQNEDAGEISSSLFVNDDETTTTVEEINVEVAHEDNGWYSDLDISEITKKKTLTNKYETICKVLNIVPVSYFAKQISQPELIMKHHGLGRKGAQAIAEVLETNNTILHLDLTDNWIEAGGACIGKALCSNYTVVLMDLSDNRLGPESGKELAEMLKYNSTLRNLLLKGNKFGDTEAEHFSSGLKENSTLQVLDLSYNDIGDIGAIAIGSSLTANETLKELNLAWNKIRGKGFNGFFGYLKDNNSILNLNLRNNGLGENGASLATYLSKSNTIQILNVSQTRLSDATITALAKAMDTNNSLREFDCSENSFTDVGCLALFKTSLTSNNIKKITIKNIKMTKETRLKLEEVKAEKQELVVVE